MNGVRHHPDELGDAKAFAERLAQKPSKNRLADEAARRVAISQWLRTASPGRPRVRPHAVRCCTRGDGEQSDAKGAQMIGRTAGYLYLGQVITVVTIGVLKRLDLISLPPVNSLTTIANNAMDAEIAAGTLQPLLATGWSVGFWLDLWRQYYAEADPAAFVAGYCAEHAALCVGL